MPQVTLKIEAGPGEGEVLQEYLCDWPDCPNVAVHVLGVAKEIGVVSVVCEEHAPQFVRRPTDGGR
jgi:hypothetical protein